MQQFQQTVGAISNFIAQQHPEMLRHFVEQHRAQLSKQISDFHRNTIAYGPLKGFRFCEDTHWGSADRAGMILGIYEEEVLHHIAELAQRYTTFVDLGAADGYYGVGVLVNNLFQKSYCFEITDKGRDVIAKNAALNGVSDRVVIKGEARKDFHTELAAGEAEQCALLIDIEGGEFDLLDASVFRHFSKSAILIELHDWVADGEAKVQKLIADAEGTHGATRFSMAARDMSRFKELDKLNDTDRWLVCSEGRPRLMNWLRLDPR